MSQAPDSPWRQTPLTTLPPDAVAELEALVGPANVLTRPAELLPYECDAVTLERLGPAAVVFVSHTDEVPAVVRWCARRDVPFVARGAGTCLSGGTLLPYGGIVIELSRLNRILDLDLVAGVAVVEAGVVNLDLTKAAAGDGWHFAPDPSSQPACTIGGNIAENAGGAHTLKYGVTINHVLALEVVLPDGTKLELGREAPGAPGYDLVGLFCGSEGTFGIVTKATVRLLRQPEGATTLLASFPTVRDASEAVSDVIAAGIIPAALELIDGFMCQAVERHLHVGLPVDAGAVLLIELDGIKDGQDALAARIGAMCQGRRAQFVRQASDAKERAALWKARKGIFGAIGLVSPSFYTHDGVIPRSKLPDVLDQVAAIAAEHRVRVANVFHAGDGNLHPIVMFDEDNQDEVARAQACGEAILKACLAAGGTLTGEHGVGLEKFHAMPWLYDAATLAHLDAVRAVFNPHELANPGKVVPRPGEVPRPRLPLGTTGYR